MRFVWSLIFLPLVIGLVVLFTTCPNAYVLTMLWSWFVSPIFHVQNISFAQALGLVLIANLLQNFPMSWRMVRRAAKNPDKKDLLLALAKPTLTLLTGWVIHLFL